MSLATMIRAANRQTDREFEGEITTDWEAKEQVESIDDKHLKRELADLELEQRKLCVEQDIRTLKHELEWRVEKRRFDKEEAAGRAARRAAAAEAAALAEVMQINVDGQPLH